MGLKKISRLSNDFYQDYSDEKGKYLFYLNENNREDYCFKKTVSDKMQRELKYPDIIKRIESIKE